MSGLNTYPTPVRITGTRTSGIINSSVTGYQSVTDYEFDVSMTWPAKGVLLTHNTQTRTVPDNNPGQGGGIAMPYTVYWTWNIELTAGGQVITYQRQTFKSGYIIDTPGIPAYFGSGTGTRVNIIENLQVYVHGRLAYTQDGNIPGTILNVTSFAPPQESNTSHVFVARAMSETNQVLDTDITTFTLNPDLDNIITETGEDVVTERQSQMIYVEAQANTNKY